MTAYRPDGEGFYGEFGGAFVPEMLHANVERLAREYLRVTSSEDFRAEFGALLSAYVGRPSPLYEAAKTSAEAGCRVFFKREDLNHTGSHKINNVIGQLLLARRLGATRIIAETGAGQHGVATATGCALMNLPCTVYMGEVDVDRQAPNVRKMRMLGAEVVPVTSGSKTLKDATNEAMRDWIANPVDTHYVIGSAVGPHPFPDMVARFQSVISEETRRQLTEQTGSPDPTHVVACVGGGSNAVGAFYHYLDVPAVSLVAVEAAGEGVGSGRSAATTALGSPGILHGTRTILMQDDDGQVLEAHSASAGLDYPGIGPLHAHLFSTGRVEYVSATDDEAIRAALRLVRTEGIFPALETAHALAYLWSTKWKPDDVVVVCLSGEGEKDMRTYSSWEDPREG